MNCLSIYDTDPRAREVGFVWESINNTLSTTIEMYYIYPSNSFMGIIGRYLYTYKLPNIVTYF